MIWQASHSGFAESSQLVWFPERLRRVFYLLTNARALRLRKIFCCLHATDPNRCVGVNRQRSSVRENHMVEGYVCSLGRREIPAQESPSPLAQNPDAFVSVVDPSTGGCTRGDSIANCQFGDSGRNTVRGRISLIRISTSPKTSRLGKALRFASIPRCSTPSITRTSRCPATWRLEFLVFLFPPVLEPSKTPYLLRRVCSVLGLVATAHPE
jgi:hypothetical protein